MRPALSFVIVGKGELVYECPLGSVGAASKNGAAGDAQALPRDDAQAHVHQFVLHSALDMVEEKMWSTQNMALTPHVDEFNNLRVRAWVCADGTRFLLLLNDGVKGDDVARRARSEDNLRHFFEEVNELYTKVALNPFYNPGDSIVSTSFDRRVKSIAVKWGMAGS